ncbi:MAG: hypothetical protein IJB45_05235 [Clostridia bacterium]|nr:hypothetical protein [Clostridia bacterium]
MKEKKEVISWVADAITAGSFSLFSFSSAAVIAATTTAAAAVAAVADNCDGNSVT